MKDEFQPTNIDVVREEAVTVTFADGTEARFDLEPLRKSCPCAECRGLRDRGRIPWPKEGSPEPLQVTHAELHGAWGLAITWNDGHATGIFPFESLRRWHDGDTPFAPDSGLGGT